MDPTLRLIVDQLKEMKNNIEEKVNTGQENVANSIIATQTKISFGQANWNKR
jgi:hypothetical protein